MVKAMKNKNSFLHSLLKEGTKRLFPYLLMSPTLLFVLIFLVVPLGFAFFCSLYRNDYMQFSRFLGFSNYIDILTDSEVLKSIGRSFYVSGISLAISLVAGVGLALWINALSSRLAYSLQIIILIPWVTSMIVAAMLWKWIFQDETGLLNYLLSQIGIGKVGFLTDKSIAIYTLIFVMTWRVVGYVMVQILAGLKSIPHEYEEAGFIDGANRWNLFWRIRFPLLKTPLTISAIIVGLSNINNLNVPLTLLAGGPGTSTKVVAIEVYRMSFSSYHFGESSALSIILCLLNFLLAVIYIKAVKYEI